MRLPVFFASGVGKASNKPINVLYVGKDHHPQFLFNKLFDETPVMKKKGEVWIWDCSKMKRRYASEVEGIIVSCDRFFHRFLYEGGWFVLPHWVGMWFDSSKNLPVLLSELSRSAKQDVKIVKKQGFSFTVTSDGEKISSFYHEMYLPTITTLIEKDKPYIADYLFFLLRYHKGYELIMISYKGENVAGVFFHQKNDTMMLEYGGVYQGDSSLIKKGALSSLYYFSIILARQRNVKKIDFGGARPFFNDGLFQYKKKWGMKVEPYQILTDIVGFTMVKKSNQFRRFLTDNPFIGIDKNGLFVWYVFGEKEKLDQKDKVRFEQMGLSLGINEVQFVEI